MSLPHVQRALTEADFKPHTVAFGGDVTGIPELLSAEAKTVFNLTWAAGSSATLAELLSSDRLPADALRLYRSCSDDERMEVLGVAALYVHETVHKIDFLTTPFGAGFHGRACLDAIGLQHDGAEIINAVRQSPEQMALRDYPRISEDYTVNEGPAAWQARILWFDAFWGAPAPYQEAGWGGLDTPLNMFGGQYRKVTVHQYLASLQIPGSPERYVRPSTILESRATAVAALNLLTRLGGDEYAAAEVARYLRTFYAPNAVSPDYRFLLDCYARLWGSQDFSASAEHNGPAWLQQALLIIIIVGWYALHAPPMMGPVMGENEFCNSNPVVRLLLALNAVEDSFRGPRAWDSGVALLNSIDSSERAKKLGIVPVKEILAGCLQYVHKVRDENRTKNSHAELAKHFDYILQILQTQLAKRARWGYNSGIGMPDDGSIMRGVKDDDDANLLLDPYEASPQVNAWFTLRHNLYFGRCRPNRFWDNVAQFQAGTRRS